MARQERVTVMLESSIKDRIHFYASAMGLTDSALGAFILGQWVMNNDLVNKPALDKMHDLMIGAVNQQMQEMAQLASGEVESK